MPPYAPVTMLTLKMRGAIQHIQSKRWNATMMLFGNQYHSPNTIALRMKHSQRLMRQLLTTSQRGSEWIRVRTSASVGRLCGHTAWTG